MWIMRHKLRLRSKLACFEFNQEKVCLTRANLYTLYVETNSRAPISRGGKRNPTTHNHYLYQCSISAKWRMSGRTELLNERKEPSIIEARVKKTAVFSSLSVLCIATESASILIPSLPLTKQLSLRCNCLSRSLSKTNLHCLFGLHCLLCSDAFHFFLFLLIIGNKITFFFSSIFS